MKSKIIKSKIKIKPVDLILIKFNLNKCCYIISWKYNIIWKYNIEFVMLSI